jgi:hypothetical protein
VTGAKVISGLGGGLALLLTLVMCGPATAGTGDPDRAPWVTDGPALATVNASGFTYLSGGFSLVGPRTGEAVPVSATSGRRLDRFPEVLRNGGSESDAGRVNGSVHAAVPDGHGGWYLGGGFTRVGGLLRNGVAHVKADGTVDPAFSADANGTVYALALVGSTLYAGGDFSAIAGRARNRLAALDAASGAARSWNPDLGWGYVLTMAVHGTDLIVGGWFYGVGGTGPPNLAAIDRRSGRAKQWDTYPEAQVNSIAVEGDKVYVGGLFRSLGGAIRDRLGAVDFETGRATEWDPCFDCGFDRGIGNINAIAVSNGVVYVGGALNYVGGEWRSNVAALEADGIGLATPWNPGADDEVFSLATSGSTVYVGGRFTTLGGAHRARVGAVDANGTLGSWAPEAGGVVTALMRSGDTVYLGGDFQTVNGLRRGGLAKLDASGQPTAWNPGANGEVWRLEAAPDGSRIYASGLFTHIGGADRSYVAALDPTTGAATAFNARANLYGWVYSMAPANGVVYVGGDFSSIGGASRERLAALDASTGDARSFNPGADSAPRNLVLDGSTVFATGGFTRIAGVSRSGLAALNTSTGGATAFNPSFDGAVGSVVPTPSRIYFAGAFTRFAGQSRTSIAAIDRSTGNVAAWSPQVGQSLFHDRLPGVAYIAVHGSALYASGDFTEAGGLARHGFAAFDLSTGGLTAWNPYAYGYFGNLLRADAGGVEVAGDFQEVSGVSSSGSARFSSPATGAPSPDQYTLRATLSPASTDGERPAVMLTGTASQSAFLSAYQHKPDVPCSASPTTEREDLGLFPTVNGAHVYGDYVQPTPVDVAAGQHAVLCAYLVTFAGVRTRASIDVTGRGGTPPADPVEPTPGPPPPPPPVPSGGQTELPGDTGPSLPAGVPPPPAQTAQVSTPGTASSPTGGGDPPTPAAASRPCRVPRIVGKPLAVARLMLNVNGCKLGRVSRLRGAPAALIVKKQSPRAGTRLRSGAPVSVVLGRRQLRR